VAACLCQSPVPSPQNPARDTAMRDMITLACNECKRRNYNTTKNKKKTTERLELKKFCPWCRTHTTHRETK